MVTSTGDDSGGQGVSGGRFLIYFAWLGVLGFGLVLAVFGFNREVYNYGTETDYLGGFIHEASRLLRGEPLSVRFHPPFYSVTIALVYSVVRDWLTTGLIVSLAASIATLTVSLAFLRKILGTGAAIGGIIALIISPTFVHFSTQTTGDLFSLAIHMSAFLAVYVSMERRRPAFYIMAGLVIGLGLVTRTNNIAMLALLLFYMVSLPSESVPLPITAKLKAVGLASAGIAIPLAIWFAYAAGTGAPFMPTQNHENLALTYFSEGNRQSGDPRFLLAEQFSSTREVLTADPRRIVRIYISDFRGTTGRLLLRDTVLPFPMIAVSLLCWIAILIREQRNRVLVGVILMNLAAMYMLINFKSYEHRYYLFLLPFIGAGIGHVAEQALQKSGMNMVRVGTCVGLLALLGFGAIKTPSEIRRLHTLEWSNDAYAAAAFLNQINAPENSIIVARKPHIGYYANRQTGGFAQVPEFDQLVAWVMQLGRDSTVQVFVFYGRQEQKTRPQFAALAHPDTLDAPGLELVASGPENDGWFLYRAATTNQGPMD